MAADLNFPRRQPAAAGGQQHTGGEVHPDHLCPGAGRERAHVARPTAQIDDHIPRADAGMAHDHPAPALVQAQRQQPIQQVVTRGDAVEHRLDDRGFLGERRES